jgi:tRNA (adenine57-N1/adenine58-N1)-methyltransferase
VSAPFAAGERALLVDRKGRRYLITLRAGGEFHSHNGVVRHDEVIGAPEGVRLSSSGGVPVVVFRPSLADFVLKMPRGAQVVYPKDIGLILIEADIYPGATVVEAGTGSGALTLALLRVVGERGRVISFEIREDFAARARENLETFLGKLPDGCDLRIGDVVEGMAGIVADRIVLDLPEPWRVVEAASGTLRGGGVFCSFVPTVGQISQTVEALRAASYAEIRTVEALVRPWHVEGPSVRPEHRMVAHTGFVVTGRFLGDPAGDETR